MSVSKSAKKSPRHSDDFSIISTQNAEKDSTDTTWMAPWMVPKILDTIFSFLIPQREDLIDAALQGNPYNINSIGGRATLFAAALTCRAISQSAQAALWNTMDSFAPIVPLLPLVRVDDKYRFEDIPVDNSRPFDGHLGHIKVFVFSRIEGLMSDVAVQMALTSIAPILFPNLSTLIIPKFVNGSLPAQKVFLPCLLASPLREVIVGDIHDHNSFNTFTSVLAFRARDSLQSILCSWNDLPRTITTLPSLHTVVLTASLSNQNSIIADLSKCTSLRRLEVHINQGIPKASDPAVFFHQLESLTLSGSSVGAWDFLMLLTSPHLHTFRFRPTDWPQKFSQPLEYIVSVFVDYRYKKRGWRSLETLEITYTGPESLVTFSAHDGSAFRPFFKDMSALSLLSLHLSLPAPLPATISLEFITSCLRRLHTLYLPDYTDTIAPTLEHLHSLARSAPNLRHLGTRIRTGPVDTTPKASNHFLDTLCVYDSPVQDTWYVTEQLDQSFPYLRKITTTSKTCKTGWKEVENLLGLCHRSRRRL
ncbi:hypothetical protein BDN72DRAFT_846372 [Pluteus cervinus]|uniref:Uncharacterized protein n=1 Tax=Pluteus cervinus TaxID=181527 RepID=A0ACD3AH19_9AGAR|nr:hypothetical protein BDN72DRAFT_846372 [Pluteus cervinus]